MSALVITELFVAEYHMPLRQSFSTARLTTETSRNVIVRLRARKGDHVVEGIGEGAPRALALTGDGRAAVWPFLTTSCDRLLERRIDTASPERSLDALREIGGELRSWARELHPDRRVERPFRGAMCGLEMALLDLVAQSHQRTVAELCGVRRGELPITATTSSADRVQAPRRRRLPAVRFKAIGDPERDLRTLVEATGRRRGPWAWIDVNESYSVDVAEQFVADIARGIRRRRLPGRVIVEQPIAKGQESELCHLQAVADRALERSDARVVIMADESFWDADDLDRILDHGGCGGLNIKMQKAGGPLAALDVARTVTLRAPEANVYLGNMIGTSDLTAWSLVHLGRSVPRLDYFTTTPPRNIEAHVTSPPLSYGERRDRLAIGMGGGYGSTIDLPVLESYVVRAAQVSAARPDRGGDPTDHAAGLHRFSRRGLYGYLLERAAIAHGCSIERTSESLFTAVSPSGHRVGFAGTRSHHTSPVAIRLSGNKQWTRELLLDAGVPVPPGRQVRLDGTEVERALDEVRLPAVLKPSRGAGGRGVHLDLRDRAAVAAAAEQLRQDGARVAVLERYVAGGDLRCLVVGGNVLSVIARRPAMVEGDGRLSVGELIALANALRQGNPYLRHRRIVVDAVAHKALASQGWGLDDVPPAGQEVRLSRVSNISRGGTSIEVLDRTSTEVTDIAVAAAAAIPGMRVAGVDLLLPAQPTTSAAFVCEVNSVPSTLPHHFPGEGPPRDVSDAILRDAFEADGFPLPALAEAVGVRLQAHGEVQGVGFRQWMRRLAREHAVRGWVRNHPAGDRVDARLGGDPAAVAIVTALAIHGPSAADVRFTRVHSDGAGPPTRGFRIRRS